MTDNVTDGFIQIVINESKDITDIRINAEGTHKKYFLHVKK